MTTTGTADEQPASADERNMRTAAAGLRVTPGRAWGMTGLVIFLYVVNYADKAVLGIIAQPLARELGMSASQIGLVGSLFYATYTVGGFLAGPLEKRFTLRWALLALALIWSVVMLPLVVSATFVALVIGRMLLGFGEGPSAALLSLVYSMDRNVTGKGTAPSASRELHTQSRQPAPKPHPPEPASDDTTDMPRTGASLADHLSNAARRPNNLVCAFDIGADASVLQAVLAAPTSSPANASTSSAQLKPDCSHLKTAVQ